MSTPLRRGKVTNTLMFFSRGAFTHGTFTFDIHRATPETCDLETCDLPTCLPPKEHTLNERKSYKHSETGMTLLMCLSPVKIAG